MSNLVNEARGVFVLERKEWPTIEKAMRAGEILVNEVNEWEAVARGLGERAKSAEAREKALRAALTELIDARGGSGKRINEAWKNARFALRTSGHGILRGKAAS